MSTISGAPVTLAELRRIDLFDGIDDVQLAEWVAVAELREVQVGELVVEEQDHVPGLILLLEGIAMTQMTSRGNPEPLGHQHAPTWIGAISLLTEDPLPVRIVAETDCRLAIIPPDEFERLVFAQRAVHQTVIRRIAPVMQRLGGIEQNRERLASLGTMAAGLTHELNNPAAAARRAAAQLAEEVAIVQKTLVKFVKSGVERADAEVLVDLQQEAVARAAAAHRAGHARRRRRRGRAARAPRGLERARAVAAGRAARLGGHRPGLARSRRRARGQGDAGRAALGRGVADDRPRVGGAVRVDGPHRARSSAR